jgi:hypothetical protein
MMPALKSTNLAAAEYDPETRTLTVGFQSGDTWEYYNVPQAVYDGLFQTSSPGGYFYRNIRNSFMGEQV